MTPLRSSPQDRLVNLSDSQTGGGIPRRIGAMARRINEELYRYVIGSIIDGNGLTLPFNMLDLLPEDLVLRMLVYGGVSGLTTRLSGENNVLTRLARFDPEAVRLLNSAMNARLTERLNARDHPAVRG